MAGCFNGGILKTWQCRLTNDFKNQNLEVTEVIEPKNPPTFSNE